MHFPSLKLGRRITRPGFALGFDARGWDAKGAFFDGVGGAKWLFFRIRRLGWWGSSFSLRRSRQVATLQENSSLLISHSSFLQA